MKRKLELKHLAPYLSYDLKMMTATASMWGVLLENRIFPMHQLHANEKWKVWTHDKDFAYQFNCTGKGFSLKQVKPILRPMSSLTDKEWFVVLKSLEFTEGLESVDINEERVNITWSNGESYEYYHSSDIAIYFKDFSMHGLEDVEMCPFKLREELLKLHVDIFGLIENDLAIDINTL
jgi:hypothetical protein